MDHNFMMITYGMMPEEIDHIQSVSSDLNEEEKNRFLMFYRSDRKDPQLILILSILGLISIAGIHRFILGQIGMGILYLFTGGLCFIGTIVDIVNHKKLTLEHNQKVAYEVHNRIKFPTPYSPQQFV